MKILCVCRGGNVRSVAAKMILKRYFGHETLACGWENNAWETLCLLGEWADRVIVMHNDFTAMLPAHIQGKTYCLHVGEDIWGNPFHEELQDRIYHLVMADKVLSNNKSPKLDTVISRLRKYRDKIAERNVQDIAV